MCRDAGSCDAGDLFWELLVTLFMFLSSSHEQSYSRNEMQLQCLEWLESDLAWLALNLTPGAVGLHEMSGLHLKVSTQPHQFI